MANPFDLSPESASTEAASNGSDRSPDSARSGTRAKARTVLGLLALGAAGVGAYTYRHEIGDAAHSVASSVGRITHTGDILSDSHASPEQLQAELVREMWTPTTTLDNQMAQYVNQHPQFAQEGEYLAMVAERRSRAQQLLDRASGLLEKNGTESWNDCIERSRSTNNARLLTPKFISGIAMMLHRAAGDYGDTIDQDAALVAAQTFSHDGWQSYGGLRSVYDANNTRTQDGLFKALEVQGIASLSLARRANTAHPGAFELVTDPAYLAAMRARVERIHAAIEAARTAGHLNKRLVLSQLISNEQFPANEAAVWDTPLQATFNAVWGALNAQSTPVNNEIVRSALLGGRPEASVLLQVDPQGGGLTRAHELAPQDVADPATFVSVPR